MTQIMFGLQKVKGQASIVDAALVSATSELLPYLTGTYLLLAMNSTNRYNQ